MKSEIVNRALVSATDCGNGQNIAISFAQLSTDQRHRNKKTATQKETDRQDKRERQTDTQRQKDPYRKAYLGTLFLADFAEIPDVEPPVGTG